MIIIDSIIDGAMVLPVDQREKIFRAVIEYMHDGVEPDYLEGATLAVWRTAYPILARERGKKVRGRAGGLAKRKNQTLTKKEPNANQKRTKKEPNASQKQSIKEKEKENILMDKKTLSASQPTPSPPYAKIVDHLNRRAGTHYRSDCEETRRLIKTRLKKFSEQDFYTVIDKKCAAWLHDPEMCRYLRPSTLFGTKFESYLNEPQCRGQPKPQVDQPDFSEYDLSTIHITAEDLEKGRY